MTTLPLFWHLSSASKKDRINASVKLVGALEQFQSQFEPKAIEPNTSGSEDEDEEDDVKGDDLNQLNAQDVSYSIRRLIRGLASPRESSRLGFAVALTELLSRLDTVTCSQIVNLILENSKQQSSMSGQEERDVLFARLFGLLSVVQSGLAFRTKPLPASASSVTETSSLESFKEIISQLVKIGDQKSWLRESAWFTLNLTFNALQGAQVPWKEDAVKAALDIFFVENTVWSTEKVALALKLQDSYPDQDWKTLLGSTFKNTSLLSSANLPVVSRILKESTTDEDGAKDITKAPPGAWKPQLNFAWDTILEQMLPGPNAKKTAKGSFQEFYRVVVDEGFFSSTSSHQRKYWGFQVFQKALTRVDEESMPMLFTKNFMRSWINHLGNKDRYLHKVAHQTATAVQSIVKDKPQLGFALILQLTGTNGSQQFDRLTKTRTVESILSSLDASGIQNYVDFLISQTNDSDGDGSNIEGVAARRAWIIDQMGALTRNGKIPKDDGWVMSLLNWLTIHGLFTIKKSTKSGFRPLQFVPSPIFSDELRKSCRSRLLNCLGDLSHQTTGGSRVLGATSEGKSWISKVLDTIFGLEADSKHVTLVHDFGEEELELIQKAKDTVAKLQTVSGDNQEASQGAQLLILGTLLQLYCSGDDEEEGFDLETLQSCIEGSARLFPEKPTKKSKKARDSTANADAEQVHEPIDVLVDTLIGYLEQSTAYMRTISNQVFPLLTGSVTESTIQLITAQLERRNPGQDSEDGNEDVEMGSASDALVDEEEEDEESADEEEEEEEEDADEDEDDENDEEAQELRKKIEEALRVNGIQASTDDTDDEDDEDVMDDDQMMAIDEKLAEVFRSRANEKKAGKNVNAQREATHFKNRVLDFVDTFVKKQPSSPLVLQLINPLVAVASSGADEQQLADKARGIIRSRFSKPKEVPSAVKREDVLAIAQEIHAQARRSRSSDLLNILIIFNAFLNKVLSGIKADDAVVSLYKDSLQDFATRKNSALNTSFFQDFIRRSPQTAWLLRSHILEVVPSAINAYRQCQVLHLAETCIVSLSASSDRSKEILAFVPEYRKVALSTAEKACEESSSMTSTQMKDLLKNVLSVVRQTKRLSPSDVGTLWERKSWLALRSSLASSRLKAAIGLQKLCDQICQLAEVPNATEPKAKSKKRNLEETVHKESKDSNAKGEGDDAQVTKPKRKKLKQAKKDS